MAKKDKDAQLRNKIVDQVITEIQFARTFKQGKVKNWKINEDLYYGRKINQEYARANVDLGLMQSHVHTILSKIDNPLKFKFTKRKEAQLERVKLLNSLRTFDSQRDDWDIKDIAGKKQCVIYGRAIYSYYADSIDEYSPHLGNIDVYDFLIDPSANGIDIETARYLGDYGVVYDRSELEDGIASGKFLKDATNNVLLGQSNSNNWNQEQVNKINRTQDQNVWQVNKEISTESNDKFKFWRWGTTYKGKRYYVLLSDSSRNAIRVEPVADMFTSDLWWYWSYAAFVDLTEFWTPSFCDYVREVFMAQAVSINQMLDNSEQINKPQKKVQIGAIENLSELKYRRDGLIKVKKDFDIDKAYQTVTTPAITAPIEVYKLLDGIQEKSSGVTAGAKGAADNDAGAKATIYEGNEANAADLFGLFNKSYSFGYKRLSKLYEWGVRDNLTRRIGIDILGPDGVELREVSRRDIFRKDDKFNVMVEASNAELALSTADKKTKIDFLSAQDTLDATNPNIQPVQNRRKSYEMQAAILGFTEEEIRQLTDKSEYGDAQMMSEAERDIETILDGKTIPPNPSATTAYKQRFVDYMTKNAESIDRDTFMMFAKYIDSLNPIIIKNMVRLANETIMKQNMQQIATMEAVKENPPVAPAAPAAPTAPAPLPNPNQPQLA